MSFYSSTLREPHEYPRRILIATIGLNPQILTETLYALAVQADQPFIPNEIYVITTCEGRRRLEVTLLSGEGGILCELATEYNLPELKSALIPERIYVVRDGNEASLKDISTQADNVAAADLITSVLRRLSVDDEAALHVSLAGGRKTMGFLLGYALSLFGRLQDRLSHVLVSPDFETHPDFYYPTKEPRVLSTRSGKPISTQDAELTLADIPFVRLRMGLPKELLNGDMSYSKTVVGLQSGVSKPALIIDYDNRRISCHGIVVVLQPLRFAFYAWLAQLKSKSKECQGTGTIHWVGSDMEHVRDFLSVYRRVGGVTSEMITTQMKNLSSGFDKEFFEENKSRINSVIRKRLGYLSTHYEIQRIGYLQHENKGKRMQPIGLPLESEDISFATVVDEDAEGLAAYEDVDDVKSFFER